jgi:hypothetical protein
MEDQPMPDVSSTAPAQVRLWVALDVHKHSIVAATLPPENTLDALDDLDVVTGVVAIRDQVVHRPHRGVENARRRRRVANETS